MNDCKIYKVTNNDKGRFAPSVRICSCMLIKYTKVRSIKLVEADVSVTFSKKRLKVNDLRRIPNAYCLDLSATGVPSRILASSNG